MTDDRRTGDTGYFRVGSEDRIFLDAHTGVPNKEGFRVGFEELIDRLTTIYLTQAIEEDDQVTNEDSANTLADKVFREHDRIRAKKGDGKLRAYPGTMAIAASDLDHFKSINDTHGHGHGDLILEVFAQALSLTGRTKREGDVAGFEGRVGGEEFMQLFYAVGPADAKKMVDKFRLNMEIHRDPDKKTKLTFSAGISHLDYRDIAFEVHQRFRDSGFMGQEGGIAEFIASDKFVEYKEKLYKRKHKEADKAAYVSKSLGRGITVNYGETVQNIHALYMKAINTMTNILEQYAEWAPAIKEAREVGDMETQVREQCDTFEYSFLRNMEGMQAEEATYIDLPVRCQLAVKGALAGKAYENIHGSTRNYEEDAFALFKGALTNGCSNLPISFGLVNGADDPLIAQEELLQEVYGKLKVLEDFADRFTQKQMQE